MICGVVEVPATVSIGSIQPAVGVQWLGALGQRYQVQWAGKVTGSMWLSFGGPVTGNGTTNTVFDLVAGNDKRFYRVLPLP